MTSRHHTDDEDLARAIHGAAHAVVARKLIGGHSDSIEAMYGAADLAQQVVIAYAGAIAESFYRTEGHGALTPSDASSIQAVLSSVFPDDPKGLSDAIRRSRRLAALYVACYWAEIVRVASTGILLACPRQVLTSKGAPIHG